MSLYVYTCVQVSGETRGIRSPGAGGMGGCELPDVGARNHSAISSAPECHFLSRHTSKGWGGGSVALAALLEDLGSVPSTPMVGHNHLQFQFRRI